MVHPTKEKCGGVVPMRADRHSCRYLYRVRYDHNSFVREVGDGQIVSLPFLRQHDESLATQ
jgi:hypothetical protein